MAGAQPDLQKIDSLGKKPGTSELLLNEEVSALKSDSWSRRAQV